MRTAMKGTLGRTSILSLPETSTRLLLTICLMLTVTALKSDGQENLRMSVDSVKAGAHEVSLFLTTYNVTSMQVTLSMRTADTSNETIIEIFQIPTTDKNLSEPAHEESIVYHAQHTISNLHPDTKYEICVTASDLQHEGTPLVYEGCYRVMTLPTVDNTTGIYVALIAMVILLLTVAFVWGIYHLCLHKFFSRIFSGKLRISSPVQDHQFNGVEQEDIQRT
ncbi:uncharacterized protein LOC122248147 [Penaeus japonicus]|uniref:uncharacterized protein LOC122248147 n=1 Tax=Penaeus japonicus TaxID=27405 RepID=UPI001C711F8A|nr:uncharacterized protein LOC122248147 [Penaeus japonicus]